MKIKRIELVITPRGGRAKKKVFAITPFTVGKDCFDAMCGMINAALPQLEKATTLPVSFKIPPSK